MTAEELTAIELKYKGQNANITKLVTEIRSNWAEIADLRDASKFWWEAYSELLRHLNRPSNGTSK